MAVITQTALDGQGSRAVTITPASASDTLTYLPGTGQMLIFNNITAGALTPNIVGDGATAFNVTGYRSVDPSSGYTLPSVAAGTSALVPLDTIAKFLTGPTVTVTGADGREISLLGN